MTKENLKKLHKHFKFLEKGDFTEDAFRQEYGDGGHMSLGKLTESRRRLIMSDAKKNREELEKKHPDIVDGKEDKNVLDKVAENKAKKEKSK